MKEYSLDYFIVKFESIPEDRWCVGVGTDADGRHDVYGHCGEVDDENTTDEAQALWKKVRSYGFLTDVNNGEGEYSELGSTPKERVLKFLRHVQNEKNRLYLP